MTWAKPSGPGADAGRTRPGSGGSPRARGRARRALALAGETTARSRSRRPRARRTAPRPGRPACSDRAVPGSRASASCCRAVGDGRALDVRARRVVPLAAAGSSRRTAATSEVRWNDTEFATTEIATDAPNRSVWVTPSPPCSRRRTGRDAEPLGVGDALGDAPVDAGHDVVEVDAARSRRSRLARRRGRGRSCRAGSAGAPRTRHRRAGRRSARSRRSRRSSSRSGRRGRPRSSAGDRRRRCGVRRRPWISMPSGAVQLQRPDVRERRALDDRVVERR